MIRVAVYTLGCKLNQVESEAIADAFRGEMFTPTAAGDEADLYIVNTCTVTSKAEQKARRMIRKFSRQNTHAPIVVTGCYAQLDGSILEQAAQRIVVFPLDKKAGLMKLPGYLASRIEEGFSLLEAVRAFAEDPQAGKGLQQFDYRPQEFTFHARAFLKIEDGCSNSCSYCRVRIARGPAVSLESGEVISRVLDLEQRGFREIVLTGVNISAYRDGEAALPDLLHMLDRRLSSSRIRLSSVEPDMLTGPMIEAFALPRIQPHIHIPMQSASARIISRIGRNYRKETVAEAVAMLRKVKEDPFIAFDLIAGLPGEEESDFRETMEMVKQCDITSLHVFPYSPRPGTKLYHAQDTVPQYIRDERSLQLRELSRHQYEAYLKRQHGREVSAVAEESTRTETEHWWNALTENYLHCRIDGSCRLIPGERYQVILDTSGLHPKGRLA